MHSTLPIAASLLLAASCSTLAPRQRAHTWTDGVVRVTWTSSPGAAGPELVRDVTVSALSGGLEQVELELRDDSDGDGRLDTDDASDTLELGLTDAPDEVLWRRLGLSPRPLVATLRVRAAGGRRSEIDLLARR